MISYPFVLWFRLKYINNKNSVACQLDVINAKQLWNNMRVSNNDTLLGEIHVGPGFVRVGMMLV